MDTTSRLNNKINEDGVKEAARGQYLVRQELKDEREYPWGSGGWTLDPCEGSAMVIIGRDTYIPLARSHNKKLHSFSVLADRHFPSSPFH